MANKMKEIRWHGRGGQGAKTASILLARIAAAGGKYIQAFPEYGPERMGAPVLAYTRISEEPIHKHCQVEFPDLVAVLDPTLIDTVDVTANLVTKGGLVINTTQKPEEIKQENELEDTVNVFTVDADKISGEELGRIFPNTPLLGAVNIAASLMGREDFLGKAEKEFSRKFSGKEDLINGNLKSVQRAMEEVQTL